MKKLLILFLSWSTSQGALVLYLNRSWWQRYTMQIFLMIKKRKERWRGGHVIEKKAGLTLVSQIFTSGQLFKLSVLDSEKIAMITVF